MSIGPNVKKLIAMKVARDAVPSGGGIADAVSFILTPGSLTKGFAAAVQWTKDAINAVRDAGEPNPWKESDDETIATELIRKIGVRAQKSSSAKTGG